MAQPFRAVDFLCMTLLLGLSSVASTTCDSDVAGCRDEFSLMQTATREIVALSTKANAHAMIGEFRSKIGTTKDRGDLVQFGTDMLQMMNATDHLNASDKSLLADVVYLINVTLIDNMDGEHAENEILLVDAADEQKQCNDGVGDINATDGAVGARRDSTSHARTSHIQCRDEQELVHYNQRDAKTKALFDHIVEIEPVQLFVEWQDDWKTNLNVAAIDNYFEKNRVYVEWFAAAKSSFTTVVSDSEAANSTHSATQEDCDQKQTLFEDEYMLYADLVNSTCGSLERCSGDAKNDYEVLLARLQAVEVNHKKTYEAAMVIVSKIGCLLGGDCSNPTIDENRYTLTEPQVPNPTECNLGTFHEMCSNAFEHAEYASLNTNTPPGDCVTCHNLPLAFLAAFGVECGFWTHSPEQCFGTSGDIVEAQTNVSCCACGGGDRFT